MNDFRPQIIVTESDSFGETAAGFLIERFSEALKQARMPLVVLPTGNTPLAIYKCLARDHAHRRDIWDHARFLTLDEYVGLPPGDEKLFYSWLCRAFMDRVGIPQSHRVFFHSDAPDPKAEADAMEAWVRDNGPIDIAVLGLGGNGHIGMNEPGPDSAFDSVTRLVRLTPETVRANGAYWGGEDKVQPTALTLGLGTLAKARESVLLVNGAHKAAILRDMLNKPVATDIPATYLRTVPGVTIIADRAAMIV